MCTSVNRQAGQRLVSQTAGDFCFKQILKKSKNCVFIVLNSCVHLWTKHKFVSQTETVGDTASLLLLNKAPSHISQAARVIGLVEKC